MRRILSAIAAIPILFLLGASSVLADGPTITEGTIVSGPVQWGPLCSGEPLMASFSATLRSELFVDDGRLILVRRHIQGDGTVWLTSTGRSFPYTIDFTSTIDPIAHTNTIVGQWAHVLIPGDGVVFKNSGRLVQDTTPRPPTVIDESNPHDYFDPGGVAELCAALGA
jgi:hypothetical protein